MDISKEILEREIVASKAAVKAHLEGAMINELVLDQMQETLKNLKNA